MNKDNPVWFLDIANYQAGLNMSRVKNEGFAGIVAKATEGTYLQDASYHTHAKNAKAQDLVFGSYHFLVSNSSGAAQARYMMDFAGDMSDEIIAVDFEHYSVPNYAYLTPGNKHLKDFISEIRKHYPKKAIAIYTTKGFWESGESSGKVSDYGDNLAVWVAKYPDMREGYASSLYYRYPDYGWENVGGQMPVAWQFTSTAKVAGFVLDANAFDGTVTELEALANSQGNKKQPEAPAKVEKVYEIKPSRRLSHKPTADRLAKAINELDEVPGNLDFTVVDHSPKAEEPEKGGEELKLGRNLNGWVTDYSQWDADIQPKVRHICEKFGVVATTYAGHGLGNSRRAADFWVAKQTHIPDAHGRAVGDAVFHHLRYDLWFDQGVIYAIWYDQYCDTNRLIQYSGNFAYSKGNSHPNTWKHLDHCHVSWQGN